MSLNIRYVTWDKMRCDKRKYLSLEKSVGGLRKVEMIDAHMKKDLDILKV